MDLPQFKRFLRYYIEMILFTTLAIISTNLIVSFVLFEYWCLPVPMWLIRLMLLFFCGAALQLAKKLE